MKDENIENCDSIISTLERVPKADMDAIPIKKIPKSSKIKTVTYLSYIVVKSTTANMKKAINSLASISKECHKYRIVESLQCIGIIKDDSDFLSSLFEFQKPKLFNRRETLEN